jgi:hypothetical protein
MFDNQPGGGAGSPPSNLPIEPEDMFAGVEKDTASAPVLPNALNAGVLKKKVDLPSPAMPVGSSPTPSPGIPTSPIATAIPPTAATPVPVQPTPTGVSSVAPPPVYAMKEPILGKIILVLVLGVMLGGLGFGGWWVYNYMQNGSGQSNQGEYSCYFSAC